MLFDKEHLITANALSHNGNALIALPFISLFFGMYLSQVNNGTIFFLCISKEQQHDEWHLF